MAKSVKTPAKFSSLTDLLEKLATNEALQGFFVMIMPEHYLIALLVMVRTYEKILACFSFASEKQRKMAEAEILELRRQIEDAGVDTLQIEKDLRALLGRGTGNKNDFIAERSPDAELMFEVVEEILNAEENTTGRLLHIYNTSHQFINPLIAKKLGLRDVSLGELGNIAEKAANVKKKLMAKVIGQDHAIEAFAEGLFHAETFLNKKNTGPGSVFFFAGPPGVGKTFLAECAAKCLGRPYRRFEIGRAHV